MKSATVKIAAVVLTMSLVSIPLLAETRTLTGIVSDSMCGATHMAKDKSPAECTRICAKGGSKYALVVDKTVYTLNGHEAELDKVAGAKATIKGNVSGETVTVQSVSPVMKMK